MTVPAARSGRANRGFTLVEATVVLALLLPLTAAIVSTIQSMIRSQARDEMRARVAGLADRVARAIERDLAFAVRVFGRDASGSEYLAAMGFERPPLENSTLPVITNAGRFTIGDKTAGNRILAGCSRGSIVIDVGETERDLQRVDVMYFVGYSVHGDGRGGLDLRRWQSAPVADYDGIVGIGDTERRMRFVDKLHGSGIRYAWRSEAPRSEGLFRLFAGGAVALLPDGAKVDPDPEVGPRSLLPGVRVRLAANGEGRGHPVPFYAVADDPFPGGFEIEIDGTRMSKLVLIRLVLRASLDRDDHVIAVLERSTRSTG